MTKAAFFPYSWRENNPYMNLLADGLRQSSIEIEQINVDNPYIRWLTRNRNEIDVLHFHWLSPLYQNEKIGKTIIGFFLLMIRIVFARILGYRIIWTMHNLYPHERVHPFIDRLVRLFMVLLSHSIIVHCEKAKEELSRNFFRQKDVAIIPIGIYPQLSTEIINTQDIRKEIGIPSSNLVLLYFGQIRPYKGLENLLSEFNTVTNPNMTLLITGLIREPGYEKILDQFADNDKRVKCIFRWLENAELHRLLLCADVIILPFRDVLTSSSVMLSFSYGKPVIAPNLGCLPYLIDNKTGFTYSPDIQNGLEKTICDVLDHKDDLIAMGQFALERAQAYQWDKIGKLTALVYHGQSDVYWEMI